MSVSNLIMIGLGALVAFGLCVWYYLALTRSNDEEERIVKRDLTYDVEPAYTLNSGKDQENNENKQ
ncbi:hypothetical protein WKH56_05635 [Priestia sp. SB1]|uniref:Uncharacterized protein n=1 Tax=Priestia aryabhattai TaxID=412384 RepID=A0AAX6NCC3_PRIAR|nr:hypothetical protein [Priestia aryabhattai]MDU9693538.1 hypothetical protein [Priestia aryabhattai]NGY88049.1 hypothetical protein [Priestia megaterium]